MTSLKNKSPLRYPGGKASLSKFIGKIAKLNNLEGGVYFELYAGGAGAALNLLYEGLFSRIHINDFDFRIYSMWDSILYNNDKFIELIEITPVTMNEWLNQKRIYESGKANTNLELGFATFFLNRTNRSGIIYKAGPIGGMEQKGNFLIDVRFNKLDLINRIKKIASFRDKIKLTNLDAIYILKNLDEFKSPEEKLFIYLDPPYYKKGKELYLNNYGHENHLDLSLVMNSLNENLDWLISYDNVKEIRQMYDCFRQSKFDLSYTLQSKKMGNELLIFSPNLIIGDSIQVNNRNTELVLLKSENNE